MSEWNDWFRGGLLVGNGKVKGLGSVLEDMLRKEGGIGDGLKEK